MKKEHFCFCQPLKEIQGPPGIPQPMLGDALVS